MSGEEYWGNYGRGFQPQDKVVSVHGRAGVVVRTGKPLRSVTRYVIRYTDTGRCGLVREPELRPEGTASASQEMKLTTIDEEPELIIIGQSASGKAITWRPGEHQTHTGRRSPFEERRPGKSFLSEELRLRIKAGDEVRLIEPKGPEFAEGYYPTGDGGFIPRKDVARDIRERAKVPPPGYYVGDDGLLHRQHDMLGGPHDAPPEDTDA